MAIEGVTGVPAQSYRERRPVAALAPYLTCVWVQQVARESVPYTHRTIPNGSAELVCVPGSVPRIVGPRTGPTEQTLGPGTVVVGVRLRPGAGAALLGVPASELVDLEIESDALWGDVVVALGETVAAAASPPHAAATLERAIPHRDSARLGPLPLVSITLSAVAESAPTATKQKHGEDAAFCSASRAYRDGVRVRQDPCPVTKAGLGWGEHCRGRSTLRARPSRPDPERSLAMAQRSWLTTSTL